MGYTISVIGCGVIGQRLGQAFAAHDDLDLKYAVDLNQEALDNYCEKFSCQGFTDYREMLALNDVDIVYVGVPPKFHYQITMDALDSGKHVICEKPISISANNGIRMAAKATETGLVTAINFVFKYTPSFIHMKNLVSSGHLGVVSAIEIKIRMPRWPRSWQDVAWLKTHGQGGPLREIGSHFIFGVQEIFGSVEVINCKVELTAPEMYEREIQVDFTANGILGKIDLITDNEDAEENTLYITGSKGKVRFRGWYILEKWDEDTDTWRLIDDSRQNLSTILATEFIAAIEGEGKLVSFEEASQVQAVVDTIFSYIS